MHAIRVLREDHERVSTLLGALSAAEPGTVQDKTRAFGRLEGQLSAHILAAKNVFLPHTEEAIADSRSATSEFFTESASVFADAEEQMIACYESYEETLALLQEMVDLRPGTRRWSEATGKLHTAVALQIENAEALFPRTEDVLEEEDFERIGSLMEHCKGQVRGLVQARLASSSGQSYREALT